MYHAGTPGVRAPRPDSGPDSEINASRYTPGSDGGSDVSAVGYARAHVSAPDLSLELLTLPERGFVLGAALLGLGSEAPAQLVPLVAERCGAALQILSTLPRERKATQLGQLARDLGAPFPAGVELCHRGWLKPMLEPEPSDLVQTLVVGAPPPLREAAGELLREREADGSAAAPLSIPPEMATELRRLVFAPAQIPNVAAGPAVAPLLELDSPRLREEVRRLGARALGASVAEAPPEVRARAMAAVGKFAPDLRESAEAAESSARRDGEMDVKSAAGDAAATVEQRLEGIGIWSLARLVRTENIETRRALAMRLPPRLAKRLLPEGGTP